MFCFVFSQFSFREAFCFLRVLISLSVSLCFSFVRLWTFKCITLLFEQNNLFVLWTFVGEVSMKYRLQTASVKHNSGLQETALQGAELKCLTAPCIIFRRSLTTWSRVWRIAKVVLQEEVQRMGTNVSISMKDFWVNYFFFFVGRGSFRLKFRWSHVWSRQEFLHSQRLFLTTYCCPYW